MSGRWTQDQLGAIEARTSLLVSAAAGSGKTSVLIERLARLLSDCENRVPAERIAVVTFTNDAAAQMRRRLSAALSKALETSENAWLCRQQTFLGAAKISTISSFCFDLLRENAEPLGLQSDFRVLGEAENDVILSEACDNVFERLYRSEPALMNALCDFFSPRSDDSGLKSNILSLYEFLGSLPFYEDWLKRHAEYDNKALLEEYSAWRADCFRVCGKYAQTALKLCGTLSSPKNEAALAILRAEADFFASGGGEADFKRLYLYSDGGEEERVKEKIQSLRDKYKPLYADAAQNTFSAEEIAADAAVLREILAGVSRIVTLLREEEALIKSRKNVLGYSDAEQLAIRLLSRKNEVGEIERTPLAKELSEYYKIIMLDEFQDINNIQDMLFKLISNGGSPFDLGNNIFAVGDVKQSIYRFRLANPKLFVNALAQAGIDGEKLSKRTLNMNFRSSKEVIDFVNFVFERIMSRAGGDVDYRGGEALSCGAEYPEADENGTKIERVTEILRINPPEGETDPDITEALGVAERIASMLGKETVFDGVLRKCEPKDFCILLRGNAEKKTYADALAAYGIKAAAEPPAGYLKSREIVVLTSLLSVIDNPLYDLPLVTVLASPMFMLSDDDLARLRLTTQTRESPLYPAVRAAVSPDSGKTLPESDPLYMKLAGFVRVYDNLKIRAASQSLERFIRTVYDGTDFLSAVSVQEDGERKKANLRLLLDYAKSYEENAAGGLSGFLRYLSAISEQGGDLSLAPDVTDTRNAVSVKTIHKSKGLEYPFVFLCGTSKKFNLSDTGLSVNYNIDYGVGFKIRDRKTLRSYDSFARSAIGRLNRRELVSEEMRLLYVALTRAKERLFISIPLCKKTDAVMDSVKTDIDAFGGDTAELTANANSMLEWLYTALLPADNPPVKMVEITPSPRDLSAAEMNEATCDPARVRELLGRFAQGYDKTLADTAAKITITEIAKSESEFEFPLSRPFFAAAGALSAAEAGTALHTFMQYADFTAAERDAKAEALRLADSGILSGDEANSLNLKALALFFKSNLYARLKRSGKIYREKKFLVEISDLSLDGELGLEYNNSMLQGIADCFFEEDGGFVLIDYKTDRVKEPEILLSRYGRQLRLYKAAIERVYGIRVKETYIYSFGLNKELEVKSDGRQTKQEPSAANC